MEICILDAKTLGPDIDLSPLKKFGNLTIYDSTNESNLFERIKTSDIIINNKVILNANALSKCKNLKMIALTSTGTNVVDLTYASNNNIAVANVAGYSTNCVVQHTFAMLFYMLEGLKSYDEYVKSGKYAENDMFTYYGKPFIELYGKTFGIIGLGEIGKKVAQTAEAFGCKVIYYSTSGKNNNSDYERVSLKNLLINSDIVSIHAALNENTKNLITYNELSLMKKSACILNLGRGSIINETDLAKALDNDIIYCAGLDVLEFEPIKSNNPLLKIQKRDKLLITPHIAWASFEARTRLVNEVCLNIEYFLNGKKRNRVI